MAFNGSKLVLRDTQTVSEMTAIQSLTELAVHTSALIHEAQKERGYTAGFLKSDGKLFSSELAAQHKSTDIKIAALSAFLDDFELDAYGTEVAQNFQTGLAKLSKIGSQRTAVSNHSVKASEAIGYYTGMHAAFLSSIASMAHQSENAEVARSLGSFAIFLEGKERAGIERALLSGALASDSLQGAGMKKLAEVTAKQSEYFTAFGRTSTQEEYALFQTAMAKPAAKAAEVMVSDTFELALSNGKPRAFDQLTESFAMSGPLGTALRNKTNPVSAIGQINEQLDAYSSLASLSSDDRNQLNSLRALSSQLPSILEKGSDTNSPALQAWSE
ncbi:MAG: nitrate- and nitrite sensing domain-containing protein [Planctomycetes bacterium]|nr:nitrate- and nitrite sensing domain-containing protein [Planctomycetota bacterium]